jgi:hypothetical protein
LTPLLLTSKFSLNLLLFTLWPLSPHLDPGCTFSHFLLFLLWRRQPYGV